jgi:hypothetical protein
MSLLKSIRAVALLIICALPCSAQVITESGERPITSVYSLEIGGARDFSTYLSPLYYEGLDMAMSASWTKAFQRWPESCVMRFESAIDLQRMLNPVGTARMWGLTARFNWGLLWRYRFLGDFQATLGPMIDIYGGAMYLVRNGNNPVNAIASAGLDIAGSLSYRFKIGRLPIEVADEIRIPSVSAFFSPQYGETYYEIYLGNHSGLAHCGWWGNAMGVDNLLSFKLNLGKTGLQLGYRFDLRTFKASGLKTQLMRNAFVIGVIPNLK